MEHIYNLHLNFSHTRSFFLMYSSARHPPTQNAFHNGLSASSAGSLYAQVPLTLNGFFLLTKSDLIDKQKVQFQNLPQDLPTILRSESKYIGVVKIYLYTLNLLQVSLRTQKISQSFLSLSSENFFRLEPQRTRHVLLLKQ